MILGKNIIFIVQKWFIDDAETDPPENNKYNGATPSVNTHPYPPHSPLEDALVESAAPPSRPRVKAGNAALQAWEGDLLDICLIGTEYMIYGVYQYWVHQNPGDHLDGGIAEDSKWQEWWENLFIFQPNAMKHLPGKSGRYFWESCL